MTERDVLFCFPQEIGKLWKKILKSSPVEVGFSSLTRGLGASIIKQDRNYTESVYIPRREKNGERVQPWKGRSDFERDHSEPAGDHQEL